jgi:hypothetical protein
VQFSDPSGLQMAFPMPVGPMPGGGAGQSGGVPQWFTDWVNSISGPLSNREKEVPKKGPANEWIDGENRSRKYGPNGQPVLDIDKPHQAYQRPHVHEWPDGRREHPGRDICPLPNG